MATRFDGYPKSAITFLRQLGKNNNRDWFQAHKKTYDEDVRGATIRLVEAVNDRLESFAPDYVAPDPRKALTRINRDIRFSADKSPYKTNLSVILGRDGGKREECAGFYFRISPEGVDIVGGSYSPGPPQLAALRKHIAEHAKDLRRIVKAANVKKAMGELQGEQLKRAPKGWPEDHPAIDLLRYKQLYFHTQLPVKIATTPDLLKELVKRFRAMTPFVTFLDAGMAARSRR